jgi:hypothetical protein
MIVHSEHDKLISLQETCKCLFGVDKLPMTTCKQILYQKNILYNYKNNDYIILSKFKDLIDSIGNLDNYDTKYLIINYNHFLEKELNGFQKQIVDFNNNFIEYLNKKKPLFYNIIVKMFGDEYFNGQFIGFENSTNIMIIKYDNINITYGLDEFDNKLYVNINNTSIINTSIYKKLYNDIKDEYLMMDIDRFVTYNLTKITLNATFAELLVNSYNKKNEYTIPLYIINGSIVFKDDNAKIEYLNKITSIYKENTLWKNINSEPHFNFEGFNKYYLNLEEKYLDSMQMKEIVNDLYFNITNELINSYRILYNHLK